MAKIISFRTACQLSKKLQKQGHKVIFTSGCFDILHIGHVEFFNKVRRWGGRDSTIFVGLDTDEYVRLNKQRLFFTQPVRAKTLASLQQIDYVVLLNERVLATTSNSFIKRYQKIKPDVVVFGNTEAEIVKAIKKDAKVTGCKFKHLPHRYKLETSSYIAKILQTHITS